MGHVLRNEIYWNIGIIGISLKHGVPSSAMVEHCLNFLVLSTLQMREIHKNECSYLPDCIHQFKKKFNVM